MTRFLCRLLRRSEGATAIEYGLIAAFIALVIIGSVTQIGVGLNTQFTSVATNL